MGSRTCLGAAIIGAIAVYVFHLGDWTFLGVPVYTVFAYSTLGGMAALFLGDLVVEPLHAQQVVKLTKQAIMVASDDGMTSGQVAYANEVVEGMGSLDKKRHVISALVGLVAYFLLGPRVGSPAAEFITIAIQLFLPLVLMFALRGPLGRTGALNPPVYEAAVKLYMTVEESIAGRQANAASQL